MSLLTMLVFMAHVRAAGLQREGAPLAAFITSVKAYTTFVTPHCALEETELYRDATNLWDAAFKKSLRGTALEAAYRAAVREQAAQDEATVYECFAPPPPPPPPGTAARAVDPRVFAIAEAQKRLRSIADSLPAFFDRGDALFATMTAARNKAVSEIGT